MPTTYRSLSDVKLGSPGRALHHISTSSKSP
eukprot:CAMPEP_0197604762 /NCGR_PEP_ID=MMETSP1326-20131121/41810_1 /TAXON_ID=1155430 /ORGANISM="Genus nov. species nov., Strain RCC2288" /LENGTH=30 /DNA_ID= /DNA_START= /DNA_END= /DNA_ORIENTATION=